MVAEDEEVSVVLDKDVAEKLDKINPVYYDMMVLMDKDSEEDNNDLLDILEQETIVEKTTATVTESPIMITPNNISLPMDKWYTDM